MRLYSLRPNQTRQIEAPIATITVSVGKVMISQIEGIVASTELEAGDTLDAKGRGGFTISAVEGGAKIGVTFADEVPAPKPKRRRAPRKKTAAKKRVSKTAARKKASNG